MDLSADRKWGENMSPRTGRPPIANPKIDRVTVRLDDCRSMALERCAKNIGTTKADIISRGIDLLEIADENSQARQLFDAIVLLYELMDREDRYDANEYAGMYSRRLSQIEFNFSEFMKSVKK